MRAHLRVIEHVTSHEHVTCPWRAFHEPIVREVLAIRWAMPDGNLAAAIGADPPFKLVQALGVYERAAKATLADERRIKDEERAAERRAKDAAQKRQR